MQGSTLVTGEGILVDQVSVDGEQHLLLHRDPDFSGTILRGLKGPFVTIAFERVVAVRRGAEVSFSGIPEDEVPAYVDFDFDLSTVNRFPVVNIPATIGDRMNALPSREAPVADIFVRGFLLWVLAHEEPLLRSNLAHLGLSVDRIPYE